LESTFEASRQFLPVEILPKAQLLQEILPVSSEKNPFVVSHVMQSNELIP